MMAYRPDCGKDCRLVHILSMNYCTKRVETYLNAYRHSSKTLPV